MNDRSAALDAAVRAQGKLIAEAQRLLTAYVETKRVHPDAVINDLLWLLGGPRQREAQRLVREALGDDPGQRRLGRLATSTAPPPYPVTCLSQSAGLRRRSSRQRHATL